MSLTTCGELKGAVASWLNRGDLTEYIPDFITLAEMEIRSKLRHWRMLNRATVELDSQYVQNPTDFLEARYVILRTSPIHRLTVVDPVRIIDLESEYGLSTGRPNFVAFGEEIMVAPIPADTYTMEMLYYQSFTPLSGDESSNWVLTYFPGLYLFGALKEAATFLHEDERGPVWGSKFQEIMLAANKDHAGHQLSGGVEILPGRVF